MRDQPHVGAPTRQAAVLTAIVELAPSLPWIDAIVLVGSMADDEADALSDIDLIVVASEGASADAWAGRHQLAATGALYSWDERPDESREIGAHRWLTPDMVVVEALIATASSGVRLARPWQLVFGDASAPARLVQRAPIARSELAQREAHPVEAAYDALRAAVRAAAAGAD
jgi:hypothetical protein